MSCVWFCFDYIGFCFHKQFHKLLRMFLFFLNCISVKSTYVLLVTLCFIMTTFKLITFWLSKLDFKIFINCLVNNWWVEHEIYFIIKYECCVFYEKIIKVSNICLTKYINLLLITKLCYAYFYSSNQLTTLCTINILMCLIITSFSWKNN